MMKSVRMKSMFAGIKELRKIKSDLFHNLVEFGYKPQEIPAAVIQLEKTHQKILQHGWRALKDDQSNALRREALNVFNQFFNLDKIDRVQMMKLLDKVPEIEDLFQYLEFRDDKKQFVQAAKDYLVSLYTEMNKVKFQENGLYRERVHVWVRPKHSISPELYSRLVTSRGWHEATPKDIRKVQDMLNNAVPAKNVSRSDEFYLQKFADIADFFLGKSLPAGKEVHRDTQAFYERQLKAINAVEYVSVETVYDRFPVPVVETVSSLRA